MPVAPKVRSLPKALALAAVLVLVDAFLMNQGFISVVIGIGLVLIGLPRTFLPKFAAVRSQRLRNLGVYFAAVIVVIIFNLGNNRLAASRGDELVAAVKPFHTKHSQYPDSLDALVPEFIESVPRAKYTLQYGNFGYIKTGEGALLYYTALPPFGRPIYNFSRGA